MKAFEKFCWDRELAYQQSTLKYEPAANQQFPNNDETDKCFVLTSNVFHKKDKPFAIYSQTGEFCSSFVLFDRVFRSLLMTSIWGRIHQGLETFIGILEADSAHLFHLKLYFFSQWNTRIEVYTVYRWAVAFFRFFDLFCWSVMITFNQSISGSIHQGHEAFSEHSRGRQPSCSESIREVLFDRSMVDLQKIRSVVHYMLCFDKPICSFSLLQA